MWFNMWLMHLRGESVWIYRLYKLIVVVMSIQRHIWNQSKSEIHFIIPQLTNCAVLADLKLPSLCNSTEIYRSSFFSKINWLSPKCCLTHSNWLLISSHLFLVMIQSVKCEAELCNEKHQSNSFHAVAGSKAYS